jgi:hypothetical protein
MSIVQVVGVCIRPSHRAAKKIEFSLSTPSYVCVLSTDGDFDNTTEQLIT